MSIAAGFGFSGLVLGFAAMVLAFVASEATRTWKGERNFNIASVSVFALAVLSFLTAVWVEVAS